VADEAAEDVREIEPEGGDDDRPEPDYRAEKQDADEDGRILPHAQSGERRAKNLGEVTRPRARPDVRT
jgi:hypothetical protein